VAVAIGWSVAFLVLAFLGAILFAFAAGWVIAGSAPAAAAWLRTASGPSILVQGLASLLAAVLATWLIGMKGAHLSPASLRWHSAGSTSRGTGRGLAMGVVAAAVALLLAVLVTPSGWSRDTGGLVSYVGALFRTGIVLAPAALAEEVIFRGVPLVLLAAAFGRGTAVVAVALVFALGHALNPHVTGLALGNIALAGVFLGLAFYAPGGLWAAFGAHFGWNLTLAALDAPVSGLPFRIPLLDYNPGGSPWISGGAFGPEGGLAATVALTAACVVLIRRTRKDEA